MKLISGVITAIMMATVAVCGGEKLYNDLASTPALLKEWNGNTFAELLPNGGPDGNYAVTILSRDPTTSKMMILNLPVEKLKGRKVLFSAKAKAEYVTGPKNPVCGVKFMVNYITAAPGNKQAWPEGASVNAHRRGSYDWTVFKTEVTFPEDIAKASFYIGLQNVTGIVTFSDIDIETVD